ncbi:hypothetical protein VPT02_153 [Vibrio phage VPT02]|uniref:Tail terminator protein n=1 Tax=Vibrio phage pVp-1 TaxID=1150989 RepID=H6WXN8_9CAUD|nr:tail terminator [Vibrio phage pVp-1]AFB84004.1 hypothetical protein pVp-1_0147 [Vibrio phage pVp-1]QIG60729.1 hypothetical protein VPT02_153 [Vibrio phage VPT02]QQO38511.1 hypothetical protein VPG01_153 [Vibrio phage VPG01]
MTHRASIRDKIVEVMKQELSDQNLDKYYTDIDMNVHNKNLYLDQVETFPAITVGLGPERPEYQPGGFRWMFLTLTIRAYVKSEDRADEELELLIQDIKTFIDTHEDIEYTITTPQGAEKKYEATQMTVISINTDEGILHPMGIGEVAIEIRYPDRNVRFKR